MPKPTLSQTAGPDVRAGLRYFTGRSELLAVLHSIVPVQADAAPPVVCVHGPPGVGKSTTARRFAEELQSRAHPTVALAMWDLMPADAQQADRALLGIRNQLMEYGATFKTFDMAYALYRRKMGHPDIVQQHQDPLSRSPLAGEVINILTSVPFLDLPLKIGTLLLKAGHHLGDWWSKRGLTVLKELQGLSPVDILRDLPKIFGEDLDDWVKTSSRSVVVILDTYEALTRRQGDVGDPESWVRTLAQASRSTLVATFGRERLGWGDKEAEWAQEGAIRNLQLGLFTIEECSDYLNRTGISDPAHQEVMIDFAGRLPLGLEIAVLITRRMSEFTPDAFSLRNAPGFAGILYTLTRFLDRREEEALRLLAVPRLFSQDIFDHLLAAMHIPLTSSLFDTIIRLPFVYLDEQHGLYRLHALMREALLLTGAAAAAPLQKSLHSSMFGYYSSRIARHQPPYTVEGNTLLAYSEGLYHGLQAGGGTTFANWAIQSHFVIARTGRERWQAQQYDALLGTTEICNCIEVAVLHGLAGKTHLELGATQEALRHIELAIPYLKNNCSTSEVYGWILLWLGEASSRAMKNAIAMSLAEQARSIFREIGHIEGYAEATNNAGFYYGKAGQAAQCIAFYREALELGEQHGFLFVQTYRNNYGSALTSTGDLDLAMDLHKANLSARLQIGNLVGAAYTYGNLSTIASAQGRFQDAAELRLQALEIWRQVGRKPAQLNSEAYHVACLARTENHAADCGWAIVQLSEIVQRARANNWPLPAVEGARLLGTLLIDEGRSDEAVAVLMGAIEIAEQGNQARLDDLLGLMGEAKLNLGKLDAAADFIDRSVSSSTESLDYLTLSRTFWVRGLLTERIGESAWSQAEHLRSLALSESMGIFDRHSRRAAWRARHGKCDLGDGPWGEPTDRLHKIDQQYANLIVRTRTAREMAPLNLAEERDRFFDAWHRGSAQPPRFIYEAPPTYPLAEWRGLISQLDLRNGLERLYCELAYSAVAAIRAVQTHNAEVIASVTEDLYGTPDAELINAAKAIMEIGYEQEEDPTTRVSAEQAHSCISGRLNEVAPSWRAIIDERMNSRMGVYPEEQVLRIRAGETFSMAEVRSLIAHEIEGHVLRSLNGERQPLSIFRLGLPGYISTEEGIALHLESGAGASPRAALRRAALRVLASSWAQECGFVEVFERCYAITRDQALSFGIAQRTKRGFSDVEARGAHLKDIVYLKGYREVGQLLRSGGLGALRALYVGKIGIHHIEAARRAAEAGWLHDAIRLPSDHLLAGACTSSEAREQ